jgi:hypothetical protein
MTGKPDRDSASSPKQGKADEAASKKAKKGELGKALSDDQIAGITGGDGLPVKDCPTDPDPTGNLPTP